MSNKICPLMSKPVFNSLGVPATHFQDCIEDKCQFWVRVYSTENILQAGDCAIALQPLMKDGLLVV